MKILVTGAAGFIGSQLSYRLHSSGADLTLIDNFSYGNIDNLIFDDLDLRSECIKLDIRDHIDVEKLIKDKKIDLIYNMAGIAPLPDCQQNPVDALNVNLTAFVNILECSRRYGVKKVIQASTNAIYENETKFPTIEDFNTRPTLIYPNTKFAAELFAESYWKTYGLSVCCLRFSNVYGPHMDCLRKHPPFIAYIIRELYYSRTPIFHSNGNQKRDYIYIDDLIDMALLVKDNPGFDIINVSSSSSYSVNDLYNIAQRMMNKFLPQKYGEDVDFWGKYPGLFEGHYKIKDEILHKEINKYTLTDNAHAKSKYGWNPRTSIHEGLGKMIDFQTRIFKER